MFKPIPVIHQTIEIKYQIHSMLIDHLQVPRYYLGAIIYFKLMLHSWHGIVQKDVRANILIVK